MSREDFILSKRIEKAKAGDIFTKFDLYEEFSNENNSNYNKVRSREFEIDLVNYFLEERNNVIYFKSLRLVNFRKHGSLKVNFEEGLNVIVGINGLGKTSIVDALKVVVSSICSGIKRKDRLGNKIKYSDIKNGEKYSDIIASLNFGSDNNIDVSFSMPAKGNPDKHSSYLVEMKRLSNLIRVVNDKKEMNFPLFVYYSPNRTVLSKSDIRKKLELSDQIVNDRFYAYEDAFSESSSIVDTIIWFISLDNKTSSLNVGDDEVYNKAIKNLEDIVKGSSDPLWGV